MLRDLDMLMSTPGSSVATPPTSQDIFERRVAEAAGLEKPTGTRSKRRSVATRVRQKLNLGWTIWLAIDVILASAFFFLAFVLVPLISCNRQEQVSGFFAGDTFGKCVGREVEWRIDRAEQSLQRLIRRSWL